jgi:AAA ATPase domain
LQVIVDALEEVSAGLGRAVVVSGAAGIGKTSLLDLARDAAHKRNFAVASARGSDLEVAYAWGVVRQLFEPRLRGMSAVARSRTLAGAAALAGPVVLPETAMSAVEADTSFGVLHGLYWLVAGLAAQRPQLLVVDDLHWADGASIRSLEFLTNRLDAVPRRRPTRWSARSTSRLARRSPKRSGRPSTCGRKVWASTRGAGVCGRVIGSLAAPAFVEE